MSHAAVIMTRPGPLTGLAGAIWALFARIKEEPAPAKPEVRERAALLLDRHGDIVLRCAYAYLHNMADAEEVLQDTLVQYLKAAPQLTDAAHERAWLLHVAANLSKNRLKYSAAHGTDELSEELAAEGREDLSFVWEAVKSLPESCREAVHLFYCEGFSTAQIAQILGRSEMAVRSALHRGRGKLREILREDYDFEIR